MQRPLSIRSRMAGLTVDIEGGNRAKGAMLLAYPAKNKREGNDNQVWELVPARDGVMIRSRLNGLVLDIQGANKAAGTRIITWEPTGSVNQTWRVVPSPVPGFYYIQSQLNGFVLDIEGGRPGPPHRLPHEEPRGGQPALGADALSVAGPSGGETHRAPGRATPGARESFHFPLA